MLNETEKKGIAGLRSNSGLVKGELLSLNVNNEVSKGIDVEKKVDLKIYSNRTILELKIEIAKKIKCGWD